MSIAAVTFLDGEYKEKDVEMLEAWKTVKGAYPDTEHVKFRTLPAVTCGQLHLQGRLWADHRRLPPPSPPGSRPTATKCDGPMFNIYHVSPHETSNPDEFVTEACYPVKKK